ncbi:hypothetical protein PVK06_004497 [Gossypium arboreum]|uniref:Uncharacterized protein n=1 Tax=Gossypium arboreum TaxID=29729 RepID=A0ABR0QTI0_GOSAR|nr:hypothetical protein PVK06_004497 [Gossypium arboreum]
MQKPRHRVDINTVGFLHKFKDLFSSPSLQPGISSASNNNSSCNEISIKNPLVKHAALAYLKPMLSPTEMVERGSFGKIKRCVAVKVGAFFGHTVSFGDMSRMPFGRPKKRLMMMITMKMKNTKLIETRMAARFFFQGRLLFDR